MNDRRRRQSRSGNVLVLTALMMVFMFGIIAFAVDLGYINVVRTQLQKSADAAAMAAAWDLIEKDASMVNTGALARIASAQATARQYAGLNLVAASSPALAAQDIQVGYLSNPSDPSVPMSFADPSRFNAVQVRTRRTADQNGEVAMFFARAIGTASSSLQAEATAAFVNNIGGFRAPSSGETLGVLPFAFDKESWDELLTGIGTDEFTCTWDEQQSAWVVTAGADGVLETNLYPQNTTGSRGNRGTVDIGNPNNAVPDIRRQILYGISPEDLEWHGGELVFDENGELLLNGDTGLSAGMKHELEMIKGAPRVIPIFREMSGNGNNAWYTIVGFAGVRIMEVNLSGSMRNKRVIIQPANICISGAVPATTSQQTSYFVYSPVWLVR